MDIAAPSVHSESRITTASARRYLGQLCKHFQHKLLASYDEDFQHGRIEFSVGVCELDATDPSLLVMRASAASDADLERLEDVVARHLERFAFREPPQVSWTRG